MPRPKILKGEVSELRLRVGDDEREALAALRKASGVGKPSELGSSEIVRRLIMGAYVELQLRTEGAE